MGVHGALARASLLLAVPGCSRLLPVAAVGLRRGGQGLEEAGDVAEALVLLAEAVAAGAAAAVGAGTPLQRLRLWDDGIQLEVLAVHRDVGGQSLQVQVTQVPLGH